MEQEISKSGDLLERSYSNLIKTRIPAYEEIWKMYIGHDGQGRMLEVNGLSANQEKTRVTFSQYHYTCLECIVGMNFIIEKAKHYSFSKINDLLQQNIDFIAFHAYVGKIRDGIETMGTLMSKPDLFLKFDNYWKERCVVIHDKKLPFSIIDGVYLILKKPQLIKDYANNEEFSWYSFNENDFAFISDYLTETFEGVLNELNSSLFDLLNAIKKIKEETHFNLKSSDYEDSIHTCNDDLTELSNFSPSINVRYISLSGSSYSNQ